MKKKNRFRRHGRIKATPQEEGGNLLVDILTLPVLGVPRMVHWIARKLAEEWEHEELDEGRVRGELLELQQRYDAGEVQEEEYDRQERVLLERLSAIRETKTQRERAA